ncbi:MAG: 4-phosphopantetheinyl transferase Npt [Pseudomonadota bacterium]|jgi:4'-phosphopantetheinyl transferase EntD
MLDAKAILGAIKAALAPGLVMGAADPKMLYPVLPEEALTGAVPSRLAEFSAGRTAARSAMGQLGHKPLAVPTGPDRAPVWPAALTGSVSHCAGVCVAVLGQRAHWSGIGIDVEPDQELEASLWPTILRPEEQAFVQSGYDALRIFVAKEAAYKAQYSKTQTLFDFHALSMTVNGATFSAQFQIDVGPFRRFDHLQGQFICAGGYTAALVTIPV